MMPPRDSAKAITPERGGCARDCAQAKYRGGNTGEAGKRRNDGENNASDDLGGDDLGGVIDEITSGLNNKRGLLKVNYRLVIDNHDLAVLVKTPIVEVLAKSAGDALDLRLALRVAVGLGSDNEVKRVGYLLLAAFKHGELAAPAASLAAPAASLD